MRNDIPGLRLSHDIPYESVFFSIGRLLRPQRLLELGTFHGRPLVWLALGSLGIQFILSVDAEIMMPNSQIIAEESLRDFGTHCSCVFIKGFTGDENVKAEVRKYSFDFAHVDGDHHYATCLNDLMLSWEVLEHLGLIFVHDYELEEVRAATFEFCGLYKLQPLIVNSDRMLMGGFLIQKPKADV